MVSRRWSTPTGETSFAFSASTSVGTVRAVNEDSYVAEPPVFLVADGMGGHARGDAASAAVVEAFAQRAASTQPWSPDAVLDAIQSAHSAIAGLADGEDLAGTTLTGVVLVTTGASPAQLDEVTVDSGAEAEAVELRYRWMVVNVGDSRVYELDAEGLRQLTVDHSLVQELVEQGVITEAQAHSHPERNVITRALGVASELSPDVLLLSAEGAHTFLVCSDGVSGAVGLAELESVLRSEAPDAAAAAIVELALDSGSRDNVTAIVLAASVSTADPSAPPVAQFEQTQPRGDVA